MKRALLLLALSIVGVYGFVHHKLVGRIAPASATYSTISTLFDGTNDFATQDDNVALRIAMGVSNFTAAAWVKPGTLYDFGAVMCHSDLSTIHYILATNAAGQVFGYFGGVNNTASAAGAVTNGTWHLVGLMASGGTGSIWVDGAHASSGFDVAAGSNVALTIPHVLGACVAADGVSNAWQLNGKIDEPGWWNTALTDAQWLELYNGGKPKQLSTLTSAAGLLNGYRMGDGDTFPNYTQVTGMRGATAVNMVDQATNYVTDAP